MADFDLKVDVFMQIGHFWENIFQFQSGVRANFSNISRSRPNSRCSRCRSEIGRCHIIRSHLCRQDEWTSGFNAIRLSNLNFILGTDCRRIQKSYWMIGGANEDIRLLKSKMFCFDYSKWIKYNSIWYFYGCKDECQTALLKAIFKNRGQKLK